MKHLLYFITFALTFVLLAQCQDAKRDGNGDLLPGEIDDPAWPVPVITSVADRDCSEDTTCPSRADDCVKKDFTVQKDTTYFLTTSYFNVDTTRASCRSCATVYLRDSVVMRDVTACPTGGPRVNFKRLMPGNTYTLSLCMQKCPALQKCDCGESARSDAIVSIRRVFD